MSALETLTARASFSILERIELGETFCYTAREVECEEAFSILERIELGETWVGLCRIKANGGLSVSSNGSNWVKRSARCAHPRC